MGWRVVGRGIGAALAGASLVVLAWQVQVSGGPDGPLACGSAWDVIAGRVGWEQWWAEDLDAASGEVGASLSRTLECPSAVNVRMVVAGALAALAIAVLGTGEIVGGRRAPGGGTADEASPPSAASRLRRLGLGVAVVGVLGAVAGLIGVALVLADPDSPMYLYVDRGVAALIGATLLVAPVALALAGWAAIIAARALEHSGGSDGPS